MLQIAERRLSKASRLFQRGLASYQRRHFYDALNNWKRAAELGYAEAYHRIGLLYASGEGVQRSTAEAAALFRRGSELGHAESQFELGLLYLRGIAGTAPNAEWFQTIISQNDTTAKETANLLFPNGVFVQKDLDEAFRWLRLAALAEKPEAQALLGDMYRWGHGCVQDYDQARCWFSAAAKHQVARAEFGLGDIYYQGLGVPCDFAIAVDWYRKAADHGDVRGLVALASLCSKGHGVPQDLEEAGKLFLRAAERGEARGHYNAALMYLSGRGLPKNRDLAETHLRRSAEQNYLPAIIALADLHADEKDTEPDWREASHWYKRAAELGECEMPIRHRKKLRHRNGGAT